MEDLKKAALAKAFANMLACIQTKESYQADLETGRLGGVSEEEMNLVIDKAQREYDVWEYINESIKLNN